MIVNLAPGSNTIQFTVTNIDPVTTGFPIIDNMQSEIALSTTLTTSGASGNITTTQTFNGAGGNALLLAPGQTYTKQSRIHGAWDSDNDFRQPVVYLARCYVGRDIPADARPLTSGVRRLRRHAKRTQIRDCRAILGFSDARRIFRRGHLDCESRTWHLHSESNSRPGSCTRTTRFDKGAELVVRAPFAFTERTSTVGIAMLFGN